MQRTVHRLALDNAGNMTPPVTGMPLTSLKLITTGF